MIHPGGRICGQANYPQWRAMIFPFHDRPDVGIDAVFTSVPEDRPSCPPSAFTDHWYDDKDGWLRETVGADNGYRWKPLTGHKFDVPLTPLVGTVDQFRDGVTHAAYLEGETGPADRCIDLAQRSTGGSRSGGSGIRWCTWRIPYPPKWRVTLTRLSGSTDLVGRVPLLQWSTSSSYLSQLLTGNTGIFYQFYLICSGGPQAGVIEQFGALGNHSASVGFFLPGPPATWSTIITFAAPGISAVYRLDAVAEF